MGQVRNGDDSVHAQQADGEFHRNSPPGKLFDAAFMEEYTDFGSLYRFLVESPWDVLSISELEAVPDNPRDAYIDEHTVFADIDEMRWVANTEWVSGTVRC